MEQVLFHVLLEGRRVGPYDRRTIVGMRIKKTLQSDHVLIGTDGIQLTVADLIGRKARSNDFSPNRTSSFSKVQATYTASLQSVQGKGLAIPAFRGEVEARVQEDLLRIAGRFRSGFGWREDRVKIPLNDIVHADVRGSEIELGLRSTQGQPMQRVRLELFTEDAAREMLQWLPDALPWPQVGDEAATQAAVPDASVRSSGQHMLWVSLAGLTFVVGVGFALLLARIY